ncbi:unnamed protein product [Urochloa decumbens]|uniref:DUF1618 domain-containing protein n=1 Tax=Urochloa decumbens TaxID=240449 RepID=A0ABC8VH35_9POAL
MSAAAAVAAAAAAAEGSRKWVLLEPYVFRRDDEESFPDDSEAPIRASGVTTCGTQFRIAFSVVEPPHISRLYAQLPGFPGPDKATPLAMLATQRHLALLVVIGPKLPSKFDTEPPSKFPVQNFFIFRANVYNPCSSSLKALPPCTEPRYDYSRGGDSLRPRPCKATPLPRMLDMRSLGLWCGGDEEEFVVAELTVYAPTLGRRCTKAFADICLLCASADSDQLGGTWRSMRVEILNQGYPEASHDLWKFARWQTHAVIPFQQWLCWIDYQQGILFCDVCNKEPAPSFLWFPPLPTSHETTHNIFYGGGGVSVTNHGSLLKFVNVTRHDGLSCGPPNAGFTITCHTLMLDGCMKWEEDYTVTSADHLAHLKCGIPMFPQVDIVRPHVVHFLFVKFGLAYEKMSVLSIDMSTKTVESFHPYVDGNEYLQADDNECPPTDDHHFIMRKSLSPPSTPFLPCEFPGFC